MQACPAGDKRPRKGGPGEARADVHEDEKKHKATQQKKALALKERYLKATAVQASIEKNIVHDAKYEWARSPVQSKKFADVVVELQKALDAERFHAFWVTNDFTNVKQEFGNDLANHFAKFLSLEPVVSALEKAQNRFSKMHLANCDS